MVLSLRFRKLTIFHGVVGILGMFFGLALLSDSDPLLKIMGLGIVSIGLYWVMDVLIFHVISERGD